MSEMLKIYLYSSFGYYVRKGDIEEKDFRGFFQKRENDLFSYSSEIAEKIKFSNFSNCIRLRKVAGKMRVIQFSPPTTFFRQLILRDSPCLKFGHSALLRQSGKVTSVKVMRLRQSAKVVQNRSLRVPKRLIHRLSTSLSRVSRPPP